MKTSVSVSFPFLLVSFSLGVLYCACYISTWVYKRQAALEVNHSYGTRYPLACVQIRYKQS